MKSSIQDDLKKFSKMERNKISFFLISKLNSFEKKLKYIFIITLVGSLLMAVIAALLSFEKMNIFLMGIIPYLGFFVILSICFIVATISVLIEEFSGKEMLKKKIGRQVYKGCLHDIFSMDCQSTKDVLNSHRLELSDKIYENKGLTGKYILFLLDLIRLDIDKKNKERNKKEEKDALVKADTIVGNMIASVEKT